MIYGWSPTIGDPDTLGWLTVVGYLTTAALSYLARATIPQSAQARAVWMALTGILVGLAINKQLDLQSLGTAVLRHVAQSEGWYAERRGLQEAFIVAAVVSAGAACMALATVASRFDRWTNMALTGLIALIAFVVVRAASFHHMDSLIGTTYMGARLNHVLELGGIIIIALAAIGKQRRYHLQ